MSAAVPIPRDIVARKPPHGAACNRCGLCCIATQCELSRHVFGERPGGPCPALGFDKNKQATCGLTTAPDDQAMRLAALRLIRSGQGCDCRINGEPTNAAFNASLDYQDFRNRVAIKAARTTWGLET